MKTNVGNIDRVIRIILGIAIIAVGIIYKSWWGAVGLVPLLTGLIRTCPLYLPCGISTNKKE